jgi:hypothetical protein
MRKRRLGKDEKREVTPEFVNMSKEILYPQIQGVTLSLSGCENLRGKQEAEQKTIARPSPKYIKTKARPVQRSARTGRGIQKRKAKQPFPERLAHAQRPPREPLAMSH